MDEYRKEIEKLKENYREEIVGGRNSKKFFNDSTFRIIYFIVFILMIILGFIKNSIIFMGIAFLMGGVPYILIKIADFISFLKDDSEFEDNSNDEEEYNIIDDTPLLLNLIRKEDE